ncbi:histidine kinase [Clostridium sp. DMHC 10]|uniref:sensor histidine kinase n=1 Tax=Clostridium sp. DMHC 10 TaxID=747377 RepID=UPI00069DBD9E|nr:ATP-binding protein [Clostridium sp. DMHC 10]KOF57200.1 histidine kinase [Clostridium sp. DMHC 10]
MLLKPINYFWKVIKSAKISIKLTVVYAFMFSLVLLILNASILYGVKYYLYNQANKQIEDVKTIILNKVTSQKEHVDLSDKELVSDVPTKQNISVRILQEDGKVLNESSEFNYIIKLNEPYDRIGHLEEGEKHLIFKNVKIESKDYGATYLQIVKDMDNEYDFLKILFVIMAIADFIGIIASVILGYIVSKRMLKPIDYITKTAESISINNLKERIEVKDPDDELKRLGNTFNNMINRLQGAFDRQVQFVSDASHELKTPIAVIQGYANLLDRWGKDDRKALEKSIYAIKLETNNMANLVEKLLFIARGDSGTQRIEKKEFWLNELITEVIRESKLIAPNHIISSDKNDTISIVADYKMLKQMLRVFVDNSIKFAPENSVIDISSELQGNKVKITVSDRGIGIPKDEVEKIFDRFYTVDKSRSKEKGGTGLGLSIAKWIADMHRGAIDVESEEGKYTKITVTLDLDK